MNKHTISKKKVDALYEIFSEDIMTARIKIARLLQDVPNGKYVDNILSLLQMETPQKAIDLFKKQTP